MAKVGGLGGLAMVARLATFGLVCLVLAAGSPSGALADPAHLPFDVKLPAGFTTKVSQGPDFTVYYFSKGSRTFVGAYVGNYPQFPVKTHGERMQRQVDGPVQQTVVCDHGVVGRRDILLVLNSSFPDLIHAWTMDLPPKDRPLAEAILTSIHTADHPGVAPTALASCPQ